MKYEVKELENSVEIYIYDLQMHAVEPRKTKSWYLKVLEAIKTKQSQRAYTKDLQVNKDDKFTAVFPTPPELEKIIKESEAKGKKVNFILPKGGAPVYAGKDLVEKMEADRKRLFK